ncbi:MAG: hypothetical protein IJT70_02720 [Clostridia bacterium]|nr:hypothetical protein [Clostridia bacterium]
MPEFKYEIVKTLGVVSQPNNGWIKELNLISWNGREPVYDLRTWDEAHERMGKGITLTAEDLENLKDLLNSIKEI